MKATVEMCQMLKAENTKLKEHLKRTHQIMIDMDEEIAKLKQDKQELIEWLKEQITENDKLFYRGGTRLNEITVKGLVLEQVLEKLGE